MKPTEAINADRSILDQILIPAGFSFVPGANGHSSGGNFAEASYVNGDRCVTFSYRFALGLVTYSVGDLSVSHKEYMQFLGRAKDSAYEWFSRESPMAGFEALRHDLDLYCQDFLVGSGDTVRQAAAMSRS